jgi:hypothetical protein
MDEKSKIRMLECMEKFGGGFVQALAQAWYLADKQNSLRLEKAFPEYVSKYRKMSIPPKEEPEPYD